MPLLIKGNAFWGEFSFGGKRHRIALRVAAEGRIPHPLSARGDATFEAARRRAEVAFEDAKQRFQRGEPTAPKPTISPVAMPGAHQPPAPVSTSIPAKTSAPEILLDQLFPLWVAAPRRKKLKSERRKKEVKALVEELIAFLANKHPDIKTVSQISFTAASGFVATFPEAMAPKTINNRLINLRALYKASADHAGLAGNPFKRIPLREVDTLAAPPYGVAVLARILAVAKEDEEIGGSVVTAICTGLRRADCAQLDWKRIQLDTGLIALPTSKTGKDAIIPILPPLRDVLTALPHRTGLCFPKAAAVQETNPDGLNLRLERLLKKAGVEVSVLPLDAGQDRIRKRTGGGFHRFKTTFVSLAVASGIPLEIVQKIVGNTDLQVLQNHYNKVDASVLKAQMLSKLPEALGGMGNGLSLLKQLRELLAKAKAEDWPNIQPAALRLLDEHIAKERAN